MKFYKCAFIMCIGVLCLSLRMVTPPKDEFCGLRNRAFKEGEQISYTAYYAVAGIYVNAGTATFSTTLERLNGKPVYHVKGEGNTNHSYDWIFKVRDVYESFIDTASLQPLKFIRNVQEGNYKKYQTITFNHNANTAVTNKGVFKVPDCIQDVISSIYYARNINFNKYKAGDRIPFSMFLDDEVFNMYIRYLGKEEIKTKYGKFRAIKFRPLLLEGTIFKGGEKMTVWVSDDENKFPIRIESPIVVGSVKVDMMSYKNSRYPLNALIKLRD